MPVSEASDTAHTRVIHAGETSLQEYVIRPGEQVGDWFETDGEVIHYVIEGTIALEIEGLGIWELGAGDAVAHPGALRNRWHLRGMGRPGSRSSTPAGRRRLSSVPCSFVRIFLHGA
ncbi:hypothetical protein [Microbacterium schleiferi]|uniref:hypothetical protein n=1 Tax=Microbacterium schleiferi TaxID=69362 RepID=UPI001E59811A|nr:hypothetical protein [Microbacterium schleiferi]